MSEYWKSTPKYWCKYCSVYVRDTGLERANHESTGRHQSALKRSLRDLHRNHEQEEREKERAKREVARLNGVVGASSDATGSRPGPSAAKPSAGAYGAEAPRQTTEAQRQAQLEQLSAMGVEIPTEYRPNMALAGDWTVTATRVIKDEAQEESNEGEEQGSAEGRAKGVRKREAEETEEKKEENEAIQALFKKRRTWGGARAMPEADTELDALLSGGLAPKKEKAEEKPVVKTEDGASGGDEPLPESTAEAVTVKPDPDGEDKQGLSSLPDSGTGSDPAAPAVVFKKRKPKNSRQK
ncbi:hypothetical protein GQ53DRAFT_743242 [Thozetella sp. PMI_491]|nr:hypothetical protein GQ53DRAFT_743242 [Thozetella sp. PMI_491]